jgi:hypothetical protein
MNNTHKIIALLGILLAVIVVMKSINTGTQGLVKYEGLAQCIKESGAAFYGTSWSLRSQDQKKIFGVSADLLPYIECSSSDGGQLPICASKKISGYPTWEFPDGSRVSGKMSVDELARKTNCSLPK